MTPRQCRMARAGLGWTVSDLASKTTGRAATVSNFERGRNAKLSTVASIEKAFLETRRVKFLDGNCVCVDDEMPAIEI